MAIILEDEEINSSIREGAAYVEEYLRIGRGKNVSIETIREVIDIYHDFLLLTDWGKCNG